MMLVHSEQGRLEKRGSLPSIEGNVGSASIKERFVRISEGERTGTSETRFRNRYRSIKGAVFICEQPTFAAALNKGCYYLLFVVDQGRSFSRQFAAIRTRTLCRELVRCVHQFGGRVSFTNKDSVWPDGLMTKVSI